LKSPCLLDPSDPQQWNGYAYGANDPINQSDPTGQRSECGQNGDSACSADADPAGGGSANNYHCGDTNSCGSDQKPCDRTCQDMQKPDPTTKSGYTEIYPNVVIRNNVKDFSKYRQLFYEGIFKDCNDGSYDCYDPTAYDTPRALWQVQAWIHILQLLNLNVCAELHTCTWKDTAQAMMAAKGIDMLMGGGGGRASRAEKLLSNEELADIGAEEAGIACEANSFPGATKVLSANGESEPIDHIKVGDKVVATSPLTGKTQTEQVTAVIKTLTDTDFTDLGVAGHTITSTQHHPYWDVTLHRWTNASDLHPGDLLRLPDGTTTRIRAVHNFTGHVITYNLTVSDLHTYYVLAGNTPVLVHNSDCIIDPMLDDTSEAYVRSKHFAGGSAVDQTKGIFNDDVDLDQIVEDSIGTSPSGPNKSGFYERTFNTGQFVGVTSPSSGSLPTSWVTVVQDKYGAIRTMYPVPPAIGQ